MRLHLKLDSFTAHVVFITLRFKHLTHIQKLRNKLLFTGDHFERFRNRYRLLRYIQYFVPGARNAECGFNQKFKLVLRNTHVQLTSSFQYVRTRFDPDARQNLFLNPTDPRYISKLPFLHKFLDPFLIKLQVSHPVRFIQFRAHFREHFVRRNSS